MFIACPHCRYLVATDPRTQSAPERCTRCGQSLQVAEAAAPAQSLATLLRRDETQSVEAPAAIEPAAVTDADADADADGNDVDVDAASMPASTNETAKHPSDYAEPVVAITGQAMSDADKSDNANAEDKLDGDDEPQTDADTNNVTIDTTAAPAIVRRTASARAPRFLRGSSAQTATHTRGARWQWAAVVALALLLTLQVLLADRSRLASDAGWRPVILALCNTLGCSVPPWREPQAFVMLDRDVRPLPGAAGVLQARATFRNEARWSQPWPILLLTLQDADGRQLGARAIQPAEYLRGDAGNRELSPGQSAQVAVNIREPSASVVAFSFDFR